MKEINLKNYYAHISTDTYIDIPDDVFDIFEEHRKAEQASQSKVRSDVYQQTRMDKQRRYI